jgi:tetratricopeptide (TPR) repeat protein
LSALPTSRNFIDRGSLLITLRRDQDAELELRQALALDPDAASAHGLLAVSLANQTLQQGMTRAEQSRILEQALFEGKQAVHLGPDQPQGYYALAWVCLRCHDFAAALKNIDNALRLAPSYAYYYVMKARIYAHNKYWKDVLEIANKGLKVDPAYIELHNWKGVALYVLGRYIEASQVIEYSLSQNPETGMAHAIRGWLLLMHKKPGEALPAFREALRLEPDYEWAAIGYNRARVAYGRSFRPYSSAIFGLARLFTGRKAEKLGQRIKLREDETTAANWTEGLLLAAILSCAAWLVTQNIAFWLLMIWDVMLIGPVMRVFVLPANKQRRFMARYVFFLALAGLLELVALSTNALEWGNLVSFVLLSWVNSYALFNRFLKKGE